MKIKEKIEEWVKDTVEEDKVVLMHPKEIKNGDYALILAPLKVRGGEGVIEKLNENKIPEVEKIDFVPPRFINFYLSKEFFASSVEEINKEKAAFARGSDEPRKIIIEYTNTNVLKPMHIGHLMGNVIGQAISNILENSGPELKRNTYQGDTGLHIAKALWGKMQKPDLDWGEAYAYGANNYEENKDKIVEINKKLFEKSDEDINKLYKEGREESLNKFEELYKKLGTKFDFYLFESEVAEDAVKIVKDFVAKDVFEESDGAIIFRGGKFDPKLHTRVFVTNQGIPTYEAKDIAHALRKEEKYKSDQSIIVTANEQNEYFKVVLKALEQINPEIANKTKHLSHGVLKLPTGKMSSRTGDVITAESLIEQVKEKVLEKMDQRDKPDDDPSSLEATTRQGKNKIAEEVAIGAIKYSILRQAIGGDIIFDFDKSISFEGDSGPYLQYTAVRANSVLNKLRAKSLELGAEVPRFNLDTWETTEVEKMLYRFPEVVERASKEYAPHHIVTYLTELASAFNSFYGKEKIIDENDPASPYKIALTEAVSHVLQNGLNLLGIKSPEKM